MTSQKNTKQRWMFYRTVCLCAVLCFLLFSRQGFVLWVQDFSQSIPPRFVSCNQNVSVLAPPSKVTSLAGPRSEAAQWLLDRVIQYQQELTRTSGVGGTVLPRSARFLRWIKNWFGFRSLLSRRKAYHGGALPACPNVGSSNTLNQGTTEVIWKITDQEAPAGIREIANERGLVSLKIRAGREPLFSRIYVCKASEQVPLDYLDCLWRHGFALAQVVSFQEQTGTKQNVLVSVVSRGQKIYMLRLTGKVQRGLPTEFVELRSKPLSDIPDKLVSLSDFLAAQRDNMKDMKVENGVALMLSMSSLLCLQKVVEECVELNRKGLLTSATLDDDAMLLALNKQGAVCGAFACNPKASRGVPAGPSVPLGFQLAARAARILFPAKSDQIPTTPSASLSQERLGRLFSNDALKGHGSFDNLVSFIIAGLTDSSSSSSWEKFLGGLASCTEFVRSYEKISKASVQWAGPFHEPADHKADGGFFVIDDKKYNAVREIGSGAYGTVYLAIEDESGEIRAVKAEPYDAKRHGGLKEGAKRKKAESGRPVSSEASKVQSAGVVKKPVTTDRHLRSSGNRGPSTTTVRRDRHPSLQVSKKAVPEVPKSYGISITKGFTYEVMDYIPGPTLRMIQLAQKDDPKINPWGRDLDLAGFEKRIRTVELLYGNREVFQEAVVQFNEGQSGIFLELLQEMAGPENQEVIDWDLASKDVLYRMVLAQQLGLQWEAVQRFLVWKYHTLSQDYGLHKARQKMTMPESIVDMCVSLLKAYEEDVHQVKKLIHYDAKPDNEIYNPYSDGLGPLDFGSAQSQVRASKEKLRFRGNPFHAAPPLLVAGDMSDAFRKKYMGDYVPVKYSRGDVRCDLYSLSILMYQMFVGAHPYAGLNVSEIGGMEVGIRVAAIMYAEKPVPLISRKVFPFRVERRFLKRLDEIIMKCIYWDHYILSDRLDRLERDVRKAGKLPLYALRISKIRKGLKKRNVTKTNLKKLNAMTEKLRKNVHGTVRLTRPEQYVYTKRMREELEALLIDMLQTRMHQLVKRVERDVQASKECLLLSEIYLKYRPDDDEMLKLSAYLEWMEGHVNRAAENYLYLLERGEVEQKTLVKDEGIRAKLSDILARKVDRMLRMAKEDEKIRADVLLLLKTFLKYNPNDKVVLETLAWVCFLGENYDLAVDHLMQSRDMPGQVPLNRKEILSQIASPKMMILLNQVEKNNKARENVLFLSELFLVLKENKNVDTALLEKVYMELAFVQCVSAVAAQEKGDGEKAQEHYTAAARHFIDWMNMEHDFSGIEDTTVEGICLPIVIDMLHQGRRVVRGDLKGPEVQATRSMVERTRNPRLLVNYISRSLRRVIERELGKRLDADELIQEDIVGWAKLVAAFDHEHALLMINNELVGCVNAQGNPEKIQQLIEFLLAVDIGTSETKTLEHCVRGLCLAGEYDLARDVYVLCLTLHLFPKETEIACFPAYGYEPDPWAEECVGQFERAESWLSFLVGEFEWIAAKLSTSETLVSDSLQWITEGSFYDDVRKRLSEEIKKDKWDRAFVADMTRILHSAYPDDVDIALHRVTVLSAPSCSQEQFTKAFDEFAALLQAGAVPSGDAVETTIEQIGEIVEDACLAVSDLRSFLSASSDAKQKKHYVAQAMDIYHALENRCLYWVRELCADGEDTDTLLAIDLKVAELLLNRYDFLTSLARSGITLMWPSDKGGGIVSDSYLCACRAFGLIEKVLSSAGDSMSDPLKDAFDKLHLACLLSLDHTIGRVYDSPEYMSLCSRMVTCMLGILDHVDPEHTRYDVAHNLLSDYHSAINAVPHDRSQLDRIVTSRRFIESSC